MSRRCPDCRTAIEEARVGFTKAAYNIQEFADAVGLSDSSIRGLIRDGDIVARYALTAKALITAEEGYAWLRSLPIERPH